MTATEIIAEIKALPPQGKAQVLQFVRSMDAESWLSGDELTHLAANLANSVDEVEIADLRSALVKGFYGSE